MTTPHHMAPTGQLAAAAVDFDEAVLGGGLPLEVETLIQAAGAVRDDAPQAEALLQKALALAPHHPATLIALYRFYFYGHRLYEAREVAKRSLDIGHAQLLQGADDQLLISDEQARFDASARFYLFALKGFAYLSLRLGDRAAGERALAELRHLDPQDRVGSGVLSAVLAGTDPQARGWSPS